MVDAKNPREWAPGSRAEMDELGRLFDLEDEGSTRRFLLVVALAIAVHGAAALIALPARPASPQPEPRVAQPVVLSRVVLTPPSVERRRIERPISARRLPVPDPEDSRPEPVLDTTPPVPFDESLPAEIQLDLAPVEAPLLVGPLIPDGARISLPTLIAESRVEPDYPELARRGRVGGRVHLQAVIHADGSVGSVRVLGESPGGLGFAERAAAAVSQWRYQPARQDGKPIDVFFTIVVTFKLE